MRRPKQQQAIGDAIFEACPRAYQSNDLFAKWGSERRFLFSFACRLLAITALLTE
jgi:hypothetical protein